MHRNIHLPFNDMLLFDHKGKVSSWDFFCECACSTTLYERHDVQSFQYSTAKAYACPIGATDPSTITGNLHFLRRHLTHNAQLETRVTEKINGKIVKNDCGSDVLIF